MNARHRAAHSLSPVIHGIRRDAHLPTGVASEVPSTALGGTAHAAASRRSDCAREAASHRSDSQRRESRRAGGADAGTGAAGQSSRARSWAR
jgi:hypothetical protein